MTDIFVAADLRQSSLPGSGGCTNHGLPDVVLRVPVHPLHQAFEVAALAVHVELADVVEAVDRHSPGPR